MGTIAEDVYDVTTPVAVRLHRNDAASLFLGGAHEILDSGNDDDDPEADARCVLLIRV